MTRYKKWDIVLTGFPYADSGVVKKRPVLVVATFTPTSRIHLLWVLMITSTSLAGWRGDVTIRDIKKAGLPIASIIRTAKIACIDARLIVGQPGSLETATQKDVRAALEEIIR